MATGSVGNVILSCYCLLGLLNNAAAATVGTRRPMRLYRREWIRSWNELKRIWHFLQGLKKFTKYRS